MDGFFYFVDFRQEKKTNRTCQGNQEKDREIKRHIWSNRVEDEVEKVSHYSCELSDSEKYRIIDRLVGPAVRNINELSSPKKTRAKKTKQGAVSQCHGINDIPGAERLFFPSVGTVAAKSRRS